MEYPNLDSPQKQTRLLHLHPGKPEDDVTCHFSILALNDFEAQYEALSYVWGAAPAERIAYVDGTPISITDNLWQALVVLRYLNRDRILWIDALCINQSDNHERSHQVLQMKQIYSQASSVEIWLGESNEYIEIAFGLITALATGLTAEGDIPSYGYVVDSYPSNYDAKTTDKDSLSREARDAVTLVAAIRAFAAMRWFERTWTVQEFCLPKKSTFHCGAHTLDGTIFMQFLYHTSKHDKSCCDVNLPFQLQVELSKLFFSTHTIRALKQFRLNFLMCVGAVRFRKATDPRDKIYGLLGLGIDDTPDHVQTDYTQSVEKVYESFVHLLLSHTKNLDILSHVRTDRQSHMKLPSFVPDWSLDLSDLSKADITAWSERWIMLNIYKSASGAPTDFKAHSGILVIRGVIADTVKQIAIKSPDNIAQSTSMRSGWNEYLNEAQTMAGIPPRDKDYGMPRHKAFWLAMVAESQILAHAMPNQLDEILTTEKSSNWFGRLHDVQTDLYETYETELRTMPQGGVCRRDQEPHELFLIDCAVETAQRGRRFMMTQGGRMGLIPAHAQEGDVVAVLTGGHVPIILRPKDRHYTVVGDAYVQGIMDGEAMPASEELEDIELR
jgi:hypothetical protein